MECGNSRAPEPSSQWKRLANAMQVSGDERERRNPWLHRWRGFELGCRRVNEEERGRGCLHQGAATWLYWQRLPSRSRIAFAQSFGRFLGTLAKFSATITVGTRIGPRTGVHSVVLLTDRQHDPLIPRYGTDIVLAVN